MKTTIKTLFALAVCAALQSCGQKEEAKDKYCGREISAFEVIDLKKTGDKGFTYSKEDNRLALDIQDTLYNLIGQKDSVRIGFIEKSPEKIGMYILGPEDKGEVEKISCYMLQHDFGGRLPKERRLLFYSDKNTSLVAGIRNKNSKDTPAE